ncbi:hypothetical protein BCD48_01085 [Pseudofrankia sp. BMG5.36]|nr:hypothetical protein BCD48_01085 [Pseudofrankia sp. BMG5.36]
MSTTIGVPSGSPARGPAPSGEADAGAVGDTEGWSEASGALVDGLGVSDAAGPGVPAGSADGVGLVGVAGAAGAVVTGAGTAGACATGVVGAGAAGAGGGAAGGGAGAAGVVGAGAAGWVVGGRVVGAGGFRAGGLGAWLAGAGAEPLGGERSGQFVPDVEVVTGGERSGHEPDVPLPDEAGPWAMGGERSGHTWVWAAVGESWGTLADAGVAAISPLALLATIVRPRLTSSRRCIVRGSIQRDSCPAPRPAAPGSAASEPMTTPRHSHSRQAQAAAATAVTKACSGASENQRGTSARLAGRSARPGPATIRTAATLPANAIGKTARTTRRIDLIAPHFALWAVARPPCGQRTRWARLG